MSDLDDILQRYDEARQARTQDAADAAKKEEELDQRLQQLRDEQIAPVLTETVDKLKAHGHIAQLDLGVTRYAAITFHPKDSSERESASLAFSLEEQRVRVTSTENPVRVRANQPLDGLSADFVREETNKWVEEVLEGWRAI